MCKWTARLPPSPERADTRRMNRVFMQLFRTISLRSHPVYLVQLRALASSLTPPARLPVRQVPAQQRARSPVGPFAFRRGSSSFAETTTKTFIRILRVMAALLFATFPIRPPFPVRIQNSVTLGQVLGRLCVFLGVVGLLQEQGTDVYCLEENAQDGWEKRLRDRLSSVDSSTSTVEITNDHAAHFFSICISIITMEST
jgi:hypothetical protein